MSVAAMVSGSALVIVAAALVFEGRVSREHERRLRAEGAVEPRDDVFRLLAVAYPAAFLAMVAEGALGPGAATGALAAGILLFVASKGLKFWAMGTLGDRWCFRVLVPPGTIPIVGGPYRLLRHPTYLAILGELLGCSLALGAPTTGAVAILVVGALIARRVSIEERAMADAEAEGAPTGPIQA